MKNLFDTDFLFFILQFKDFKFVPKLQVASFLSVLFFKLINFNFVLILFNYFTLDPVLICALSFSKKEIKKELFSK